MFRHITVTNILCYPPEPIRQVGTMYHKMMDTIQSIIGNSKCKMVSKSNNKQFALEYFPVLQYIDWDIADTLADNWHLPKEEITLQITEEISLDKLKIVAINSLLCGNLSTQDWNWEATRVAWNWNNDAESLCHQCMPVTWPNYFYMSME